MNNKTITTITLTQTPLKQRKKNIRNAHTTEPLAICNIIEKIVLMPFSGFHVLPSGRICLCNGRIYQSQTKVEFSGNLNRNGISVCCRADRNVAVRTYYNRRRSDHSEATSECCLSAISGYLRYGCL